MLSRVEHEKSIVTSRKIFIFSSLTKMYESAKLIFLCEWTIFLIQFLPVSFDIFNHQIFTSQLHMIWKVIDNPRKKGLTL